MDMTGEDILKKALLDTQEKVRDFMNYAREFEDEKYQNFFREAAKEEGMQAQTLGKFLDELN